MKQKQKMSPPTLEQLEKELKREKYRRKYQKTVKSTASMLVVVAAVTVLLATLLLPVLRIYGFSMSPTLIDGDVVISLKGGTFERGEVIAFYYNNKILVKRVVGLPGEWIDIDSGGNVSIDGEILTEPYLSEKALGECNIGLPYQVPEGRYFVMGDYRSVSSDSRSLAVGCVAEEQIVGRLIFRIWPLDKLGTIR